MMSSTLKIAITHGLVFGLGIGAAVIFGNSSPQEPSPSRLPEGKHTQRATRKVVPDRLTSPAAFRAAYSDLLARTMSRSERSDCMEALWQQWGESDPEGLLAFLENKRVWPEDCSAYLGLKFPNRPDLALDFALRYGCSDVLQQLSKDDQLARLLAALPKDQKGEDILSLERETHRKLGMSGAEVAEQSPAYLRGVAEALLEEGKTEEFFDTFGQIEDPVEKKDLAKKFGEVLSEEKLGEKVLEQILRLPEPYREVAAYELGGHSGIPALQFPAAREERRRWIARLAEVGLIEVAASDLRGFFRSGDVVITGEEWASWIASFPEGEAWQPLTKVIFSEWSGDDREGMLRQICALPAGATRDMMVNGAASETIEGRSAPFDEDQQKIFDTLANLQSNPEARALFVKRFAPSEPSADDDAVDPFANE